MTLQEHDRIHHPDGYHEGDTCKYRDNLKKETPEDKADELHVEGKGGKQRRNKPSIIDKLKQEIAKVRDAYEGLNGNRSQEWLKAPNGADSNLSEDLWVFVRTPSFKKWFGDWENDSEHASKVLDENGEPMVLYHCSDDPDIKEFIVPWEGPIEWDGLPGLFFSPKPQTAYGKNVYSVFLNIRRPTDMDGKGERRAVNGRSLEKLEEFGKQYEDSIKANEKEFKFSDDGSLKITDKGLDSLKSDGYYGTLAEDGTKEYAVLSPQQVMMLPKNVAGKGDVATSGKGDKVEETVDNKPLVTPEEDAAYMEAVEKGDMETAAKMVREAAAKAMPDTKMVGEDGSPRMLYKGKSTDTTKYEGDIYLSNDIGVAKSYVGRYSEDGRGTLMKAFVDMKTPLVIDASGATFDTIPTPQVLLDKYRVGAKIKTDRLYDAEIFSDTMSLDDIVYFAKDAGYDGVEVRDIIDSNNWNEMHNPPRATTYVAFNSRQIKSADPVTYDDQGNVIPLSRRFDDGDDIRGDVSGKSEYIEKMKSLHPDINPNELINRLKGLGSREEMEAEIAKILGKR